MQKELETLEMHDHVFANQAALAPTLLPGQGFKLGLNSEAFKSCLDASQHDIRSDMAMVQGLGVTR